LAQPNSNYSEALSATIANYSADLADNVTNSNTLLKELSKKKNVNTFDGGVEIVQGVKYPGTGSTIWYAGYETIDMTGSPYLSSANFAIRQAAIPVTFAGIDEVIHTGKANIHDFFKSRIDTATATMMNGVATAMYYSNTENNGKSIGGLQHLVSDTGTGTVGGIDSSVQTWWKNYVYDFSNNSVTASASTIINAMNDAYLNTTFGTEEPDLIIAGSTFYGYFETALQANQRFIGVADAAQAGFGGYRYKNAVVKPDLACSATRMYLLNTNFLHWRPSSKANFIVSKNKEISNQDAYANLIKFAGNLTTSGRRYQAVIVL
jgi:hypothetical protein